MLVTSVETFVNIKNFLGLIDIPLSCVAERTMAGVGMLISTFIKYV